MSSAIFVGVVGAACFGTAGSAVYLEGGVGMIGMASTLLVDALLVDDDIFREDSVLAFGVEGCGGGVGTWSAFVLASGESGLEE